MAPSHQRTLPPISSIKINVDAAIGPHCSSIASVARDWRWELVFACSKRMNTILPLQAEAEAIKWALTLATNLEFEAIIIELDSQVCSNLLSDLEAAPLWRIKSICEDSRILLASSSKISICWVPKLCNMTPHSLANWSLAYKFFGSFDVGNNTPTFVFVIQGEACLLV